MTAFLSILACFAGVVAFAFGLAGFVGLAGQPDPARTKAGAFLMLFDLLATQGFFSLLKSVADNWESRVEERRLFCAGLACGAACVALVIVIRRMS